MDGLEPVTDHDSKVVMLASERRDLIQISGVVTRFDEEAQLPEAVSVIERKSTYYGPELLVHTEMDGLDHNFLLNAPGPDSHLFLWAAATDEDNRRESWHVAAEVKATLAEEQPTYEICPDCGKPMKSIEHERRAALGTCGE